MKKYIVTKNQELWISNKLDSNQFTKKKLSGIHNDTYLQHIHIEGTSPVWTNLSTKDDAEKKTKKLFPHTALSAWWKTWWNLKSYA